ncbi:hypothetical protein CALCODRAFT_553153 [Calocera cornea HHB12733]|uniref:Uncharacterized protein n=1 Tax=Calocera cornea HHB12733 TaxID=1353952 RepID=A0A165J6V5_9BASI|nr:hypothetical protein CALCODRAFT_553153 [Calocera cornea HHB12733]
MPESDDSTRYQPFTSVNKQPSERQSTAGQYVRKAQEHAVQGLAELRREKHSTVLYCILGDGGVDGWSIKDGSCFNWGMGNGIKFSVNAYAHTVQYSTYVRRARRGASVSRPLRPVQQWSMDGNPSDALSLGIALGYPEWHRARDAGVAAPKSQVAEQHIREHAPA